MNYLHGNAVMFYGAGLPQFQLFLPIQAQAFSRKDVLNGTGYQMHAAREKDAHEDKRP